MLLTEIVAQTKSLTKKYVLRKIVSIAYTGKEMSLKLNSCSLYFPLENKKGCCPWSFHLPSVFTESQNGWGWKGLLDVILSCPPVQAGPPTAGCPGPCPDGFLVFTRMESPQNFWETWTSAQSPSQ